MTVEEMRRKTDSILKRLKDDPSFCKKVEADPHGELKDAGLSDEVLADIVGGQACAVTCIGIPHTSGCTKSAIV
jgi:hypothetical protein